MEFNLLSLELKYETKKDKTKINQITCNLFCNIAAKRVSWQCCELLYPPEADEDRTCWTTQTHSDERNSARRQTFHERNSISLVRLMKHSMSLHP